MILTINPNAGSKSSRSRVEALLLAFEQRDISLRIIRQADPQAAVQEIAQALAADGEGLISAGGDGTVHLCANAWMQLPEARRSGLLYAHFPTGTGNDWARTYRIPKEVHAWMSGWDRRKIAVQDLAWVQWQSAEGVLEKRYFANVAGIGFDAAVARQVALGLAGAKSSLVYLRAALQLLFGYRNTRLRIRSGQDQWLGPMLTVNVGICPYSGGGMRIVPHARPDDGELALTLAGDLSAREVVFNIARLFNGKIGSHAKVNTQQVRQLWIEAQGESGPVWLEADGEVLGTIPAELAVVSSAFRVLDFR